MNAQSTLIKHYTLLTQYQTLHTVFQYGEHCSLNPELYRLHFISNALQWASLFPTDCRLNAKHWTRCFSNSLCRKQSLCPWEFFRRCITPRSDSLRQTMLFHLKPILHEEAFPGHQYVATSPARYLSNIRLLKLSLKLLSLLSLKFSPPPQLDNCATLGCWSWRLWRPWQWLLHTLMHLLHVAYVAHVLHMCSLMY